MTHIYEPSELLPLILPVTCYSKKMLFYKTLF